MEYYFAPKVYNFKASGILRLFHLKKLAYFCHSYARILKHTAIKITNGKNFHFRNYVENGF